MTAPSETRRCALSQCGKPLVKRLGEHGADWTNRRFCNVSCARTSPQEPVDRLCGWSSCAARLTRRPGETSSNFRARRYCDQRCRRNADHQRARSKGGSGVRRPLPPSPAMYGPVEADVEPGWRKRAACFGEDPDTWFPIGTSGPSEEQERHAKAVCRSCPVWRSCRNWALAAAVDYGIYGGLTERERRKLRRDRELARAGVA